MLKHAIITAVLAVLVVIDRWLSGPPAGNDELPAPQLHDVPAERFHSTLDVPDVHEALAAGFPTLHPLESESCEIDELLPIPTLTPLERARIAERPFSLN